MLHDHEALTNPQFQHEHSLAFHEGRQVEEIVGLHWHLAFPEDVTGEQVPVSEEISQELPLFACASVAVLFESVASLSMKLTLQALEKELDSFAEVRCRAYLPDATQPRSFLQTLLSKLPLSAVTGVCLI